MDLQDLPATAFPKLQQLVVRQTQVHNLPFEGYLLLCEFVQNVWRARLHALTVLSSSLSDEADIRALIRRLRSGTSESLNHHGSVFALYLLGAYQEAAELVEEYFERRNSTIASAIKQITGGAYARGALQELNERLEDFLRNADVHATLSTRIKKPGSLFAKLISTGKFDLDLISAMNVHPLREDELSYDLVGAEITIDVDQLDKFHGFCRRLSEYFISRNVQLTNQLVYSPDWMGRQFFEGKMKTDDRVVPFQLHVWNLKARRYEWLSYGNYKMNKLFYPLIKSWQSYLDRDLEMLEYSRLVISTVRATFNTQNERGSECRL